MVPPVEPYAGIRQVTAVGGLGTPFAKQGARIAA